MLSLDSVVVATTDQVSCDLDGEAVILSLADGVYYGLDPVGARIWAELQSRRTVREIRNAILAEYDVDGARCERDLLSLLQDMAARKLVNVQDVS
jgi:hypothetical protein